MARHLLTSTTKSSPTTKNLNHSSWCSARKIWVSRDKSLRYQAWAQSFSMLRTGSSLKWWQSRECTIFAFTSAPSSPASFAQSWRASTAADSWKALRYMMLESRSKVTFWVLCVTSSNHTRGASDSFLSKSAKWATKTEICCFRCWRKVASNRWVFQMWGWTWRSKNS